VDEMNQLASAVLTLVFAAVMLIAGQLYIGTKSRFPAASPAASVLANSDEQSMH
jgi:hypothetical protein